MYKYWHLQCLQTGYLAGSSLLFVIHWLSKAHGHSEKLQAYSDADSSDFNVGS